ncbi:MAG: hypothetical protein K2M16_10660 [Muribaculaceae bacterium]|nr:hypothetical protein [Muribaculaceae bacterium]
MEEAASIFDDVLAGRASDPKKNCVIANAAFAIHTLEPELSLVEAVKEAKESLESGAALDRFNRFVNANR